MKLLLSSKCLKKQQLKVLSRLGMYISMKNLIEVTIIQ